MDQITDIIRNALQRTPPELSHDIFENGIRLTGGDAFDVSFANHIELKTGIRTQLVAEPLRAVSEGLKLLLFTAAIRGGGSGERVTFAVWARCRQLDIECAKAHVSSMCFRPIFRRFRAHSGQLLAGF